jgi:predicted secreted protein
MMKRAREKYNTYCLPDGVRSPEASSGDGETRIAQEMGMEQGNPAEQGDSRPDASTPGGPRSTSAGPPGTAPRGAAARLWWLWVLIGVAAVFLIAFFIGRATTGEEDVASTTTSSASTSTTEAGRPAISAPMVAITEEQDGSTVKVAPGWIVLMQLTGNPEDGSTWNVDALNASLVQALPGPTVSYLEYSPEPVALYTYAALALKEGEMEVYARRVDPTGKELKTFRCTIAIVPEEDIPPTTATSSSSTTSSTSTTERPTTTTTEPPTTTSTETGSTTTEAGSTTTAPPPSLPPTTTSTLPPTTTTTLPALPPLPEGVFLIGPKSDGQFVLVPQDTETLVLALPDQPPSGNSWRLAPFDGTVLGLRGEPDFVGMPGRPDVGARVWRLDVLGIGSTALEATYQDASGEVVEQFYVTVQVQPVAVPF